MWWARDHGHYHYPVLVPSSASPLSTTLLHLGCLFLSLSSPVEMLSLGLTAIFASTQSSSCWGGSHARVGWTLGSRKAEEGGLRGEERKDGFELGWRGCAWN